MTTTVQSILEAAYNRGSNNDPGKLAQDSELILHLDRIYQRAWPLIARARPDLFQSETTIALIGSPPAGTLPADLIALIGCWQASGLPVNLIPTADRTRTWNIAPSVYQRGMTLVSRNQAGDPVSGDTLTLTVLDAPVTLSTLAQVLDARWPIRHVQMLVDYLANYLAVKDAGRDAGDRAAILNELQQDSGAFAADFGLPPQAVQWMHEVAERKVAGATG